MNSQASVKDILQQKADEVIAYFTSLQISCRCDIHNYIINVKLQAEHKKGTLSLAYSSKKRRWTSYSNESWIEQTIIPQMQSFLAVDMLPTLSIIPETIGSKTIPKVFIEAYFKEALDCFCILVNFEHEYIDFSVIEDYTQKGVERVLKDPYCANLDQAALREVIKIPLDPSFSAAKEYLLRCLTLCQIPIPTNL